MWIFRNDSFLSVVAHTGKPGYLLVRSRVEGDIQRAVPGAEVYEIEDADYRYRADVSKEDFREALSAAVDAIDYPNFKRSIPSGDVQRSGAYHRVWKVLVDTYGAYGRRGS